MRRILFLAALLLFPLSARSQTIGFAQVGAESDWRTAFSASMKQEAARRGLHLLFADAGNDVGRQRQEVRGFIAKHVDAIIIAPVVVDGWSDVLKEAKEAAIPVFIADRAVRADPSLYVARIAASSTLEGRLAAAWLAQATNGKCDVVELEGTAGSEPALQRHSGFLAVAALFPDIRIIRAGNGNFTTEGGRSVMTRLMSETNNLAGVCAVLAHNDNMLLGAIGVMQAAGVHPGRDIITVSFDGLPNIYRAMLAGEATMSVEVKSDTAPYIYDVVQRYLKGERSFPKWIVIPSALHTRADAAAMLERHGS